MKKLFSLIFAIVLLFTLFTSVYAHSGRTDGNGGHYDDGGYYHYHHGFPAHDHPGGRCPYAGEDPYYNKDNSNNNSNNNNSTNKNNVSSSNSSSKSSSNIGTIIFFSILGGICLIPFLWLLFESIKEKILSFFRKADTTSTNSNNETQDTETQTNDIESNNDMKNYNIYTSKPSYNTTRSDYDEIARLKARIAELTEENQHLKNKLYLVEKELEKEKRENAIPKSNTTPNYLKLPNKTEYYESLERLRTNKTPLENIIIYKIAAKMYSENSGKIYNVSLNSCTCEDFKFRKKPCKHMIAFAIEIGALKK